MEGKKYKNSYTQIFGNVLMQMSLKQAEKLHGEKVTKWSDKDMEKLYMMNNFKPVIPSGLLPEDKEKILKSLISMKETITELSMEEPAPLKGDNTSTHKSRFYYLNGINRRRHDNSINRI